MKTQKGIATIPEVEAVVFLLVVKLQEEVVYQKVAVDRQQVEVTVGPGVVKVEVEADPDVVVEVDQVVAEVEAVQIEVVVDHVVEVVRDPDQNQEVVVDHVVEEIRDPDQNQDRDQDQDQAPAQDPDQDRNQAQDQDLNQIQDQDLNQAQDPDLIQSLNHDQGPDRVPERVLHHQQEIRKKKFLVILKMMLHLRNQ